VSSRLPASIHDGDPVATGHARSERPVPFAVPERLQVVDSTKPVPGQPRRCRGLPGGLEVPEGYGVVGRSPDRRQRPAREELASSARHRGAVLDPAQAGSWPGTASSRLRGPWRSAASLGPAGRPPGSSCRWKWPNDLIAGAGGGRGRGRTPPRARGDRTEGRRGILSEILAPRAGDDPGGRSPGGPVGIVVGIGINVNWPVDWPPVDSEDPELVLHRCSRHFVEPHRRTPDRPGPTCGRAAQGPQAPGTRCLPVTRDAAPSRRSTGLALRDDRGARSRVELGGRDRHREGSRPRRRPGAFSSPLAPASGPYQRATSSTSAEPWLSRSGGLVDPAAVPASRLRPVSPGTDHGMLITGGGGFIAPTFVR